MITESFKQVFFICISFFLFNISNASVFEYLDASDMEFDALNNANNYTKYYRILKKKPSENVELVSIDSLNVNVILQAKYAYNNEQVNNHQEYVFTSYSNHLFLTDTLQRMPATNKTLIQLYKNSTLIGYDLKITLTPSVDTNSSSLDFEFALMYYREEDIENIVDGTLTKFSNMLAGDIEWRKISFTIETTEAMIFTLENGYETEIFMYSSSAGNMTQNQYKSPQLISRYAFTTAKGEQTIFILLRRVYQSQMANTPEIINFALSIFAIFSESALNSNQKTVIKDYTWTSAVTSQFTSGGKTSTSQEQYRLSLFRHPFANFDVKLPIFNIHQLLSSNLKLQLPKDPPHPNLKDSLTSTIVLVYEIVVPISDYSNPYFLGATATSCNSLFKYSINKMSDPLGGDLKLTDQDIEDYFSDKFSNIDFTSTKKILVDPSEYASCQPNCLLHAALHIEILVDPSSDMATFKLQGNQLLHSLTNPSNPFFDYLPLSSYTFFQVILDKDLSEFGIQYYSGFDHSYVIFNHSFMGSTKVEEDPKSDINSYKRVRQLQYFSEEQQKKFKPDVRPVLQYIPINSSSGQKYQSGQMVIKPANKGVHIFSALNLSPVYSPFTIQINQITLKQLTNSSYIAITLNGFYDTQSFYYDKIYNKDKEIQLLFGWKINNLSLFAITCDSALNISSCPIPNSSTNEFSTKIQSTNSTSVPDLCPNQTCHILFSVQYTPFSEEGGVSANSEESTTLKSLITFYLSLQETKFPVNKTPDSSSGQQGTGSSKDGSTDIDNQSDNNSKYWIMGFFFVLIIGLIIVSALVCYFKKKENQLKKEIQLFQNQQKTNEEKQEDLANRTTSYSNNQFLDDLM